MPYTTTNDTGRTDVKIFYQDVGEGDPVVLIHGWPLSHRMWEQQVDALVEAGHRVISYDRRGFGDSSKPWGGYDYDTMAEDLHALLEELEVTDATLVGFSMGGGEVGRYIGNYGTERIDKAVLMSSIAPYLLKDDSNPEGVDEGVFKDMKQGVKGDRPAFLAQFGRDFLNADGTGVSDAQLDYLQTIATFASPRATLQCIDAFAGTDLREDLQQADIPVLVIHGTEDQIVPFEVSGKRVPEFAPNATVETIEGAPHGLNITHAEQANSLLLDFLRS